MSFLDNLENNLKALESAEESGPHDNSRRDRLRAEALAAAPWAERLRKAPFTQTLMQQATIAGRPRRLKVNLMWIDTKLRLEARGNRLELRPGAKGITAVFMHGADDVRRIPIDLAAADPQKLVNDWMADIDEQKRIADEQAARMADEDASEDSPEDIG
jgi:hypothetical protein